MEPRAAPAATRGRKPYPHPASASRETDSKIGTDHDGGNTPGDYQHLKSVVLGYDGGKVVFSDALGLTFAAQPSDPRAASLECRVLAYEHAAKERWTKGRTPDIPERLAA